MSEQVFRYRWNRDDVNRRFMIGYQHGRDGTQGEPMLCVIDAEGQKAAFDIDQVHELIAALQHVANNTNHCDGELPSFDRP